ncbi:unnamed protein product, partial [Laminaria digitata]
PAATAATNEHEKQQLTMAHLHELETTLGLDEAKVKEVSDAERLLASEMEYGISEPNEVFVEVLAAAGLRPTGLQGLSDPYCVCYLKVPGDAEDTPFRGQRGETYFVEKTLYPKWSGQRFVFKVPVKAAQSKRGYGVRVLILSRHILRPNDFLGQADVPLSLLQDERERVGWFPLNRRSSRLMHLAAGDKITGSIKLRVRWVQSIKSFLHCRVQGLESFLGNVEARLERSRLLIERLRKEEAKEKKTQLAMTMGGQKEHSKVARLKRHLEKMGFKGIGDIRDGNNRQKTSSKLGPTTPRHRGADANAEHSRTRSLTLNDTTGRYGDLPARLSPFNGRADGMNNNTNVLTATGGTGGDAMGSAGPPRSTPSSPSRRRASLAISGRRLSAWTFGSGTQLAQTLPGALGTEGGNYSPPVSPTSRRGSADFTSRRRNQRRGGTGGSPVPSTGFEGSTSSQARGFKRLTRRLSFRQRQAQANYQVRVNARRGSRTLTPSAADLATVVARAGTTPGPTSPHTGNTTSGAGRGAAAAAAGTAASGAKPDRGGNKRDDANDDDRAARRSSRVAPWLTMTRSAPGGTGTTAETELKVGKKEAVDGVGGAKSKMATRG